MDFIASLRPVCETIFYFLLVGYMTGIHARYQRSYSREESTDAWQAAHNHAKQALQHAITASARATAGDYTRAEKAAEEASEQLGARLVLTYAKLGGP